MTVPFPRPFSCFQAFSAAPVPLTPLSRPPFVTNLLPKPVSDLFQFYPAFPPPSRLISIFCRILASVPPYFLFRHILTSVPPYFIFCHIFTSVPPYSIFCCILASVPPYFNFLPHSRLCPALFLTSFYYFQCIYNSFSLYFRVNSFCPYLLHTLIVFISSSNATLSADSEVICIHFLQ